MYIPNLLQIVMITIVFYSFIFYVIYNNIIWNHFAQTAKTNLIPQIKYSGNVQDYKLCETCRPTQTNINVDCVNYDKFNKLITHLHRTIETNTQVLKVVGGERSSIIYLIQAMNSDLVKLKVKRNDGIDIDMQNEIIRVKDRINNIETLFNTRFNIIENPINELLKTILQKL